MTLLKRKMLQKAEECEQEVELRTDMVEYIQYRMTQISSKSSKSNSLDIMLNTTKFTTKQLHILAKLIEIQLFADAKTRKEYMESANSDHKIKSAVTNILRRRLEKKYCYKKIVGFRTKMTIIPTMMKNKNKKEEEEVPATTTTTKV